MGAYSTAEAAYYYIACADKIAVSERNDFMDFFKPLPHKIEEEQFGVLSDADDAVPWVDNTRTIAAAKSTEAEPRSRHCALRYHRVRDQARRICSCPTNLMKAEGLTKLECSANQRRLLLSTPLDYVNCKAVEPDYDTDESDSGGEQSA